MASRHVFRFSCPCCGKPVEVDTRSGKARAANPADKHGGKDLDALLGEHGKEQERLGSMFDEARRDQASEAERLEQLLRKAKEEAAQDEDDDRPVHPFDRE